MTGDRVPTAILSVQIIPNADPALLEKLAQQAKDQSAEFVTIFYGEDVTDEQAQAAEEIFSRACPGAELSVLPGGQPVYYYIVSIE